MQDQTNRISTIRFWIVFSVLVLLATFLRFYDIGLRPMHNDEGVNYHFIKQTLDRGYYPYSHENYHGPSYFYLLTLATSILGTDEFGMRFVGSFFGVLTLFLLIPLRTIFGSGFVLISTLGIAISPSLVFYSRYAIHETIFLFATLWIAVSILLWIKERKASQIYSGFAALALIISTKETFIINLFSLGLATLSMGGWRENLRALVKARKALFFGTFLCISLILAIFSGGFQWADGIRELFLAVPQWLGRNTTDYGHFKPFWYYLAKLIAPTEPYLRDGMILSTLIAVILSFVKFTPKILFSRETALPRFLFVWSLVSFLAYSYVKYKTPWLIVSITLPLYLYLAFWIGWLLRGGILARIFGTLTLLVVFAVGLPSAFCYNFREIKTPWGIFKVPDSHPYGADNPFSYVHTSDGMLELTHDIEHYLESNPQAGVLVGVAQYWPMPYYLRNFKGRVGYQVSDNPVEMAKSYDVLILNKTIEWKEPGWIKKYYRLSDVQESNTFFRIKKG